MITLKQIGDEIAGKIRAMRQEDAGVLLHKQFLISSVMADHDQIAGVDRDFAVCCERYTIEQQVDRYFRSIKQAELEGDEQQVFPGYERLQRQYICERNGDQVVVPVYEMTDEELDSKAAQHVQMGDGHYRHARELILFKEERRRSQFIGSVR